jgi:hypothetical protein
VIELHPDQTQLLDDILDRPLASVTDLATEGAMWPKGSTDRQRRADYTVAAATSDDSDIGQLGFTFVAD